MFSNHNGSKLRSTIERKNSAQWVKDEVSGEIKNYVKLNEMKIQYIKMCGTQLENAKRNL